MNKLTLYLEILIKQNLRNRNKITIIKYNFPKPNKVYCKVKTIAHINVISK